MRVLFIGDIVGKGGRRAVRALVPGLRREYGCSFVIANGENMAGGGGMTAKCLGEMKDSGVDVFTSGDHLWDQRIFLTEIQQFENVLRPANVSATQPGRGCAVFPVPGGGRLAVISLLGRVFMNGQADCPFRAADRAVAEVKAQAKVIVVDIHAEATSEKTALGRYLDGRVSAVFGTHTHVPTADEQIFPKGTAYLTDVGMVGARESVLGREIRPVLQRFSTGMPARFTVADDGIRLHAVLVDVDPATGQASAIERVCRDA